METPGSHFEPLKQISPPPHPIFPIDPLEISQVESFASICLIFFPLLVFKEIYNCWQYVFSFPGDVSATFPPHFSHRSIRGMVAPFVAVWAHRHSWDLLATLDLCIAMVVVRRRACHSTFFLFFFFERGPEARESQEGLFFSFGGWGFEGKPKGQQQRSPMSRRHPQKDASSNNGSWF